MAESKVYRGFKLKIEVAVVARAGGDVTLPCHLFPETSAVPMMIRWFKETECIYLYKNGQVIEGRGYEGRVSLDTPEMKTGNVSLRLRDMKESEHGVYICQVIYGEQKEEAFVNVWSVVHGLGASFEGAQIYRFENVEHYLETESIEDKLKRETSACLLEDRQNTQEDKHTQEEDIRIKNAKLAQQVCDLMAVVERLESELTVQKNAAGGKSTDTNPTLPIQRRRSKDLPLLFGGESSSPVTPSVSELRLVLLGRTGAGRRAAGDTILGREEFESQASPSAVTQRSRRRDGGACGRRLVLVDTPDWFCPGLSLEETRQDVGLCVRLSAPGPHAFLLVVAVQPSGEEKGLMERMEDMFGEGCWRHTVILFTHAGCLREQSMEEFLQTGSWDLQQLVEKCENRYHLLNIEDRAHETLVPELLEQVEKMVSGNTESFYSSHTYQEAEVQVREMEGKRETERKEREEMREIYEGEAKVEAERNLMKVVLPELQRNIIISREMQRESSRQLEKDRQIEEMNRQMEDFNLFI